jgi:hypothetical protein
MASTGDAGSGTAAAATTAAAAGETSTTPLLPPTPSTGRMASTGGAVPASRVGECQMWGQKPCKGVSCVHAVWCGTNHLQGTGNSTGRHRGQVV